MKRIFKYILTFCIMIISFLVFLTITSLIPKSAISENVRESSEVLNEQTNELIINVNNGLIRFDNYTDALMINTAYSIDTSAPFYSSMMARKNYIKGKTEIIHQDENGKLKSVAKYKELDQVGELNDTVNNDIVESFEYARYWHGYLILLRPLLVLFNIIQIRLILTLLLNIIGIIFIVNIFKEFDVGTTIIFICGLILCDYFYIGTSLQGTPVFLIAMISAILLLKRKIKDKLNFFLIIGGLTSFFDFLTVPMITLEVPLLIYTLMENKNKKDIKQLLIELLKNCFMWGIGYIGVWFTKWILVDLVYNKDMIKVAINQAKFRSNITGITILQMFTMNLGVIKRTLSLAIFIIIILSSVKLLKYRKELKINYKEGMIYLSISLLGLIWMSVLKQHTYNHMFFTYRNYWIIIVCWLLAIYNLFTKKENK